jgi:hypothetical protein
MGRVDPEAEASIDSLNFLIAAASPQRLLFRPDFKWATGHARWSARALGNDAVDRRHARADLSGAVARRRDRRFCRDHAMTGEPIWFVVARSPSGESPSVVVGQLPANLRRKIAKDPSGRPLEPNPLIYSLRLDKLPAEQRARWIDEDGAPVTLVSQMYRHYCRLRDSGKLPRV